MTLQQIWKVLMGPCDLEYKQLEYLANEEVKKVRNIYTLVRSRDFRTLWDKADAANRCIALQLVQAHEKEGLKQWMLNCISSHYGTYSWGQLVNIAMDYRIRNYSRMTRLELIEEIDRYDKRTGTGDQLRGTDGKDDRTHEECDKLADQKGYNHG